MMAFMTTDSPTGPAQRYPRRWLRSGIRSIFGAGCLIVWLVCTDPVWAQTEPAPAAPGQSGMVQVTRPLWTEMAITVVMVGLALFAICRSSNRN